ncbi:twin-arginine translocase subunit TatC [Mannheimia haemolytica]|uniref:twin-arginine translocase subunit TatC n=1 Tax=Mannheimia haemolytica TaxID=75985 RepID=UPI0030D497AF
MWFRCFYQFLLFCTKFGRLSPLLYTSRKSVWFTHYWYLAHCCFIVVSLFAYYIVFPLVFGFLTSTAPEGVTMATDISSYLDFVLTIFMAFGICFEVPVAIILLCWAGVTTPEDLKAKRPYIIVAAFVIGMLLTPPDIFSQTLLAIPMCLLFEVGVLFARFYRPKDDDEPSEQVAQ